MAGWPANPDSQTCSLLVYGSLMHPAQWRSLAGQRQGASAAAPQDAPRCGWITAAPTAAAMPVMVAGFSRDFRHQPTWRAGPDTARGVLRVRPSADRTINAVMITGVPTSLLEPLDYRERGYFRRQVALERITPWQSPARPVGEQHRRDDPNRNLPESGPFIYEGRTELHNPKLTPHPDYLALCLQAAAQFGEGFRQTFLDTTDFGENPFSATCNGSSNVWPGGDHE